MSQAPVPPPSLPQSQGVSRLKELLFDSESQALAELGRRIDLLAETTNADRKRLVADLEALFDKVGTAERLEKSVAGVIDGALRQAEVERHDELADAVSPLVVRTVKTEIRNSRDELVEALYPMTGRMVKAYVASAMKDLMEQVNRRLEQNPVMLRLAALVTGRSAAELALADTQRTEVEQLYLIRRGTGELVGHWPDSAPGGNREQVVSGVLSALTEFAGEAFRDDGRALRQIDLGPSQVYLRLSPLYLLAVRCKGSQHAAVEQVIDDEFLAGLESVAAITASQPPGALPPSATRTLLRETGQRLAARIAEKEVELAPPRAGVAVLKAFAWLVGLPLVAWLAWTGWIGYETSRARAIAEAVVAANTELSGYPASIFVEPRGRTVTISGLAPLPSAKEKVVGELRRALPGSEVRDQLAVVPSGLANAEPLIRAVREDLGGEIARERTEAEGRTIGEREARIREIAALRDKIAALEARPATVGAPPPTAREQLAAWARAHAIFFGNSTDFREPQRAAKLLDELALLMKQSEIVLRVVGYTDETGPAARNSTLSQTRAETVAQELVARGVPQQRLVTLGRQNSIDIAPTTGAQSANRRVEFELGFDGEPGR